MDSKKAMDSHTILIKLATEQIKTYAVYEINETLKSNETIFLKSYFTQILQLLHFFARYYNDLT